MKNGIYKIVNKINNKFYIGSAAGIGGFKERWRVHLRDLKNNKHHSSSLQRSVNKYGIENFEFLIVLICEPSECISYEQKLLDHYKVWDRHIGFNTCKIAGSTFGFRHSEISKNKMSEAHKNKVLSIEHRKNLSKGRIGNKNALGYRHTEEWKIKNSIRNTGKILSKETIQKMKKSGLESHIFQSKRIERIDPNSGEVKEYFSINEANREGFNKRSVGRCLKDENKQFKNYFWKFC